MSLFEEILRGANPKKVGSPQYFIEESPEEFRISVEVPKVSEEALSVVVKGNLLGVSGERAVKGSAAPSMVTESPVTFARVFHLPPEVSTERIEAQYSEGTLEIIIPRDKISIRQIPVRPKRTSKSFSPGVRTEVRGQPHEAA